MSELAPLHPRDNTFPGEVFLDLAAEALDWCRAGSSVPGRCRGHGWLDVGDAADGDGLGAADPMEGDGLGVGELAGVGERLGRGV